jgi:dihydroxyacetone kinase-like protein
MIAYEDILTWIRTFAETVAAERTYLTELDSAIGDADHGINMDRGMHAILGKLDGLTSRDIGGCLKTAGSTLVSTVGGASGPLYGMFFMGMGGTAVGKETISLQEFATAFAAGIGGVERIGKAQPGDKTMLEALLPARDALQAAADQAVAVGPALQLAANAAEAGMLETVPLVARKGRASYLGERSAGHQDPGATSSFYLVRSAAKAWSGL